MFQSPFGCSSFADLLTAPYTDPIDAGHLSEELDPFPELQLGNPPHSTPPQDNQNHNSHPHPQLLPGDVQADSLRSVAKYEYAYLLVEKVRRNYLGENSFMTIVPKMILSRHRRFLLCNIKWSYFIWQSMITSYMIIEDRKQVWYMIRRVWYRVNEHVSRLSKSLVTVKRSFRLVYLIGANERFWQLIIVGRFYRFAGYNRAG